MTERYCDWYPELMCFYCSKRKTQDCHKEREVERVE